MNQSNDTLQAALAEQNLDLPEPQAAQLDAYCRVLWEWNEKINLTRHTDYEKFVTRDVVDSLALAEQLRPGEKVLDVGSGGGVPGVVLAIARPDLAVTLSESIGKKANVLGDMVERLGLPLTVVHGRAEDLVADMRFDTLVVRAVARLMKMLPWFAGRWDDFGRMLLVKGPSWVDERAEARHHGLMHDLALRKLASYPIPGTESESVILQITRKT
ncbi:MAG: 16S rRNA (guanine(527)-N(7))-methyltransferase RsmG [Pirellulales bacterium]|nr:16S rRNA (guanine(527)-N(7))-methyltransferase RsmG [Pirellulales bacterium]